ncbi:MAG: dihydropteroate synthase [Clostridiales bacterium]|nr:dihydropteroate synthase [Clostridiales bacterium]
MYWNCKEKKIEYGKRTLIMGIVNVTPDSFSDGGDHFDTNKAVDYALKLANDKADIIDIGGQSTRPGHTPVSPDEEWDRIKDVLKYVRKKIDVPISVDTYYPNVAQKAVESGADIINDVSGIFSADMAKIVKKTACGWIIMHNGGGTPNDVREFFEKTAYECAKKNKIEKSQICFDVGIGFGKDYDMDMSILANIDKCKLDGYPLLLGTSRKRVIGRGSNQENPKERIYGNIAADTLAVLKGANIIRLHDVKNEKQGILMADSLKEYTAK